MLSVGIVGLPNVGKSTLFNAMLKKQQAYAANYPFATIEPNVGVVPVPDNRLGLLAEIVDTESQVPATVKFVDIAGIVEGAHKGEGLGSKFLAHIREASVILHVLRAFNDEDVVQTGSGDPVADYLTIETELQLSDLETLEKQKEPKGKVSDEEKIRWEAVVKLKKGLESGVSARDVSLSEEEERAVRELFLLTMKSEMYAMNIDEGALSDAKLVIEDVVSKFSSKDIGIDEDDVVVINAKIEEELAGFSEKEREEYLSDIGIEKTGLEFLVKKAYKKLGLVSFLTAGEKEVRAWTIEAGSTAPEAAGVIHSDFEKHFIKAKVCEYSDFVKYQGWKRAAEMGKVRQEGKDYVVKGDDIIEFVTSV